MGAAVMKLPVEPPPPEKPKSADASIDAQYAAVADLIAGFVRRTVDKKATKVRAEIAELRRHIRNEVDERCATYVERFCLAQVERDHETVQELKAEIKRLAEQIDSIKEALRSGDR